MNSLRSLLAPWGAARERGEGAALATVVHVRGSAYRRPEARLLLLQDGASHGLISGGCLENDVRARCREAMASGQSELVTYDTTSSQDIVWGLGLADWEALKYLLPSPCRYIGLLGPRRRADELLEKMPQRTHTPGIDPTPEQIGRLHAPIGLDIGAETPEEIALSIVAKVRAWLSLRSGAPLRQRQGNIHAENTP